MYVNCEYMYVFINMSYVPHFAEHHPALSHQGSSHCVYTDTQHHHNTTTCTCIHTCTCDIQCIYMYMYLNSFVSEYSKIQTKIHLLEV